MKKVIVTYCQEISLSDNEIEIIQNRMNENLIEQIKEEFDEILKEDKRYESTLKIEIKD